MNAPIALFVYNRPQHTFQTLNSLKANYLSQDSELYIISDAPRKGHEQKVQEVRALIKSQQWCGKVTIIENEENKGVDNNVVENVTSLLSRYGKIIVIEDDCFLSPYFLPNMNEALLKYEFESRVMHVSGYCEPSEKELPSNFFIHNANGWGWATWKRAWDYYEPNATKLHAVIAENDLFYKFNYGGKIMDMQRQLEACADGRMNNWDIKWYASQFLKDGLALKFYPSLVNNIGHDGTGEHCDDTAIFDVNIRKSYLPLKDIPVLENTYALNSIADYMFNKSLSFLATIKHVWIKKIFGIK
jgi:hypothetical protein